DRLRSIGIEQPHHSARTRQTMSGSRQKCGFGRPASLRRQRELEQFQQITNFSEKLWPGMSKIPRPLRRLDEGAAEALLKKGFES
ncbi:MAG TPA: hypothetical protein VNG33_04005, partial [Polyangiaceae bacterium]|nr:hypothetical protein [Polyangiaceae bacterium]